MFHIFHSTALQTLLDSCESASEQRAWKQSQELGRHAESQGALALLTA